jgi:hypothetical protein
MPTKDYLKLANPKFLGKATRVQWPEEPEQDIIVSANKDLKESTVVLDRFMDWVVRELERVKTGRRPEGPLQGVRFVR